MRHNEHKATTSLEVRVSKTTKKEEINTQNWGETYIFI